MTDDDDLRDRLRHADPAATLAPAAPEQVAHLVEEAMSRTTRRWVLPVAAALVLIAGGTAWAVTRQPERTPTPPPVAQPAPAVRLTASGIAAKCREPEAARLAESADFAFEGTVSGITAGVVTLGVTHVFRGAPTESVQVSQAPDISEQMLGSGTFETGRNYLVAASEGTVLICGYSGEADSIGLRELYDAAF